MEHSQTNERVGAIRSASDKVVELYGYGIYLGDQLRPQWKELAQEMIPLQKLVWAKVLEQPEEGLVAETLNLMQAQHALQKEAGIESETITLAKVKDLVAQRKKDLAERLHWSEHQLLTWLSENSSMLCNPKILLDDGRTVWGFECWWGPEDKTKKRIDQWQSAGHTITYV